MEKSQQLSDYVAQQLQNGQTPDEVASQLAAAGWPQSQIEQAFTQVQSQVLPSHMQPQAPVTTDATQTAGTTPPPQANGKRRGRIRTGWMLLKHSLHILNGNRYLLRYFLMTWLLIIGIEAAIILFLIFVTPEFFDDNVRLYILAFFSYLIIFTIINFYAAALAKNIFDIYDGKRQPYKVYTKAARRRFGPIFVYSLISAIIGVILEYVVEKLGRLGQIISWLIGTAWSIMTMFTLPIIMDSKSSGPSAIKQSFGLLKQTWGEGITAKVIISAPLTIIQILLFFIVIAMCIGLYAGSGSYVPILVLGLIYLFISISIAVIGSYANSLVNVALYYYATKHQIPPGYSADMLNSVLIKKRTFFKKKQAA